MKNEDVVGLHVVSKLVNLCDSYIQGRNFRLTANRSN